MTRPYDSPLIMMVAQMPFETAELNQFCKLIPVVYADGTMAKASDFPNQGEIWWMLTSRTQRLAIPGKLVIGTVEHSREINEADPNWSRYQVKKDSVRDLEVADGMVILDLGGNVIEQIEDVVSGGFSLDLDSPPTQSCLIRWRSHIYGPFLSEERDSYEGVGSNQKFSFRPPRISEMKVSKIEEAVFDSRTKDHCIKVAEDVSRTMQHKSDSYECTGANHSLLLQTGWDVILAGNPAQIVIEPFDQKLMRFAKQCLTRKKRQELGRLLSELDFEGKETSESVRLAEQIGRAKAMLTKQDVALDKVTQALLSSGALGDERLRVAEKLYAQQYVEDRTAELLARVDKGLLERRNELRSVETELKELQSRLKLEETSARSDLKTKLKAERAEAERTVAKSRDAMDQEKLELERQQKVLRKNLEKVTKDLRESGEQIVNQFLTIMPLLNASDFVGSNSICGNRLQGGMAEQPKSIDGLSVEQAEFKIPDVLHSEFSTQEEAVSEEAFFDRFVRFVEDSGFRYRRLDLQRFHLSVKCGDLTVLGGPSGVGKSTLPSLYSQALLGNQACTERPECLMVNVNPSWMEIRDLLGHMNTLDNRFYPAESGLFQHLVFAQSEYSVRGTSTAIYLSCLDEMNLSQVEHYFGDFLVVLERHAANRYIQCFTPEAIADSCPFRSWGRLTLSPAIRFIGTVNYDETTRLLSDRLLDRVNFIKLGSGALPSIADTLGVSSAEAVGRLISLSDFEKWRTDNALPSELAALVDQMRPALLAMGCPLSPRVYRSICRFIGSATRLMDQTKAFDVQVAQRIVPKIRSLVAKRQIDALDELLRILEASNTCSFDETIPLVEEIKDSAIGRPWAFEE